MSLTHRGLVVVAAVAALAGGSVVLTRSTRASADLRASDVNVSCAPSQRALIRQVMEGTSPRVDVLCVDAASAVPAGYAVSGTGRLMPVASSALATPAYDSPAIRTVRPAPSRTRRVVTGSESAAPMPRTETKPSWQKRAVIIGGSAGAGAGIGALAGGKKGALIGAAIGGGGAAILDQIKNR